MITYTRKIVEGGSFFKVPGQKIFHNSDHALEKK